MQIGSGFAMMQGSRVWEIVNEKRTTLAKFDHAAFNYIVNNAAVYFLEWDERTWGARGPMVAENVQPRSSIDLRIAAATPANGFQQGVDDLLRRYIMENLLGLIRRRDAYNTGWLDQLMRDIQRESNASPEKAVTLQVLEKLRIRPTFRA